MNKIFSIAMLCQLIAVAGLCQVAYDNNPAAGHYAEIRGFKMYYEIYGAGKPLLMIPGNDNNISAFGKNIPYFSERYKVIAADSRAQGKSTDNSDSLSFEMMADDYDALLTSLHVDKCFVVGWSDGGIIALLLALRHPDKVLQLVSTGANLWPDSTAIRPSSWKYELKEFTDGQKRKYNSPEEKNKRKLFLLDWYQPQISLKYLHQIKCPALIIAGDHDVINPEHTVLIYEHIPRAYLWIIPHSGHSTFAEHSDDFNNKVHQFFSEGYQK